jgi:hypothetical protein
MNSPNEKLEKLREKLRRLSKAVASSPGDWLDNVLGQLADTLEDRQEEELVSTSGPLYAPPSQPAPLQGDTLWEGPAWWGSGNVFHRLSHVRIIGSTTPVTIIIRRRGPEESQPQPQPFEGDVESGCASTWVYLPARFADKRVRVEVVAPQEDPQ